MPYVQMNQSRILRRSTQPSNSLCRSTSRDMLSFRMFRSSMEICPSLSTCTTPGLKQRANFGARCVGTGFDGLRRMRGWRR